MRTRTPGLHEAISRLAAQFEYGALMADTTPVAFLDEVTREVTELRARVASLTTALTKAREGLTDIASAESFKQPGAKDGKGSHIVMAEQDDLGPRLSERFSGPRERWHDIPLPPERTAPKTGTPQVIAPRQAKRSRQNAKKRR